MFPFDFPETCHYNLCLVTALLLRVSQLYRIELRTYYRVSNTSIFVAFLIRSFEIYILFSTWEIRLARSILVSVNVNQE